MVSNSGVKLAIRASAALISIMLLTPQPASAQQPSPTDEKCQVSRVMLDRSTVGAAERVGVQTESSGGAGVVALYAYTQPSTTYRKVREAAVGADGRAVFTVAAAGNTRLYSKRTDCPDGPGIGLTAVLNVRTVLTLRAEQLSARTVVFSGDSVPARPRGLIISLYRETASGEQVLTSQARASSSDGTWSVRRSFLGSGTFGFFAATGQDLQNAPGHSNRVVVTLRR